MHYIIISVHLAIFRAALYRLRQHMHLRSDNVMAGRKTKKGNKIKGGERKHDGYDTRVEDNTRPAIASGPRLFPIYIPYAAFAEPYIFLVPFRYCSISCLPSCRWAVLPARLPFILPLCCL
jgi:hypothetical protein